MQTKIILGLLQTALVVNAKGASVCKDIENAVPKTPENSCKKLCTSSFKVWKSCIYNENKMEGKKIKYTAEEEKEEYKKQMEKNCKCVPKVDNEENEDKTTKKKEGKKNHKEAEEDITKEDKESVKGEEESTAAKSDDDEEKPKSKKGSKAKKAKSKINIDIQKMIKEAGLFGDDGKPDMASMETMMKKMGLSADKVGSLADMFKTIKKETPGEDKDTEEEAEEHVDL